MELFEFTKIIFENPGEWKDVTPGEKRKHFFMAQRRFSIRYPMQANALQHIKVDQAGVMDFWQSFLRKQYNRTPGWMYTKGVKKSKEVKENKLNVKEDLINSYASKMEIDKKSIYEALEYWPDKMLKELKTFEKIIKQ